jgi:hypothetical protein
MVTKDIGLICGLLICGAVLFYSGVKTGSNIYKEANVNINANKNIGAKESISDKNISLNKNIKPKNQKTHATPSQLLRQSRSIDFKSSMLDKLLTCKTVLLHKNLNKKDMFEKYNLNFMMNKEKSISASYDGTIEVWKESSKTKQSGSFGRYVRYLPSMKDVAFLVLDGLTFAVIGLDKDNKNRFIGNVFRMGKANKFDLIAFAELNIGR